MTHHCWILNCDSPRMKVVSYYFIKTLTTYVKKKMRSFQSLFLHAYTFTHMFFKYIYISKTGTWISITYDIRFLRMYPPYEILNRSWFKSTF